MNIFFLFYFIILSKIFKIFPFKIIIHMNGSILWHLCYINLEILSIPIIITELINCNFLIIFVHSLGFSRFYYFTYVFIKCWLQLIERKGNIIIQIYQICSFFHFTKLMIFTLFLNKNKIYLFQYPYQIMLMGSKSNMIMIFLIEKTFFIFTVIKIINI